VARDDAEHGERNGRHDDRRGDEVAEGDVLLVTEAMKMETNVKAPKGGVIKELIFGEGDQIDQGDLLVVLA